MPCRRCCRSFTTRKMRSRRSRAAARDPRALAPTARHSSRPIRRPGWLGDGIDQRDLTNDRFRDALAAPRRPRRCARRRRSRHRAGARARRGDWSGHRERSRGERNLVDGGAALLASLCAPAMRARLDALAVAGAGQSLAPEISASVPRLPPCATRSLARWSRASRCSSKAKAAPEKSLRRERCTG